MRLIWVSAHMQKCTASWTIKQGEMCFYFFFLNVVGYFMWKIISHGEIYICIDLWIICG